MRLILNHSKNYSKFNKIVLFIISIGICLFITKDTIDDNLPKLLVEKPIVQDPSGYVKMAYNLINHGIISLDEGPNLLRPTNYREPGYPVYLAFGMILIGDYEGFPLNNLLKGENTKLLRKYHLLLIVGICVIGASILLILTNYFWSVLLMCGLVLYYLKSKYSSPFLSEPLAILLFTLFVFILILSIKYNRKAFYFSSGIVLAFLVLTKAIYSYIWPLIILLIYLNNKKKKFSFKFCVVTCTCFFIPYLLITGSWMVRNKIQLDQFSISSGRDDKILSIRSYFNEMTLTEGLASFLIYSDFMNDHPNIFNKLFPNKKDYEKVLSNTFRKNYMEHKFKIYEKYGFEKGNSNIGDEGLKKICKRPVKHLLVSLPLMFRMLCGHGMFPRSFVKRYFEVIIIIGSLLFLVYIAVSTLNVELYAILLPVIYSIGIYGIISNGISRYLAPLVPLFYIVILLTVSFSMEFLFKLIRTKIHYKTAHKCINCSNVIWEHPKLKLCNHCVNEIISNGLDEKKLSELYNQIAKRDDIISTSNSSYTFDRSIFFWIKNNISKESTILELGSGGGYFSESLRKEGFHNVTASEFSEEAVNNIVRRFPKLKCLQIDASNIFLENSQFDLIISIEVIEHLLNPEKHFQEVKRILKNGGQYIIRTPNRIIERLYYKMVGRYDIKIWHPSTFTPYGLKKELKTLNYHVDTIEVNSLPLSQIKKLPSFLRPIFTKVSPRLLPQIIRPSIIFVTQIFY